MAAHDFDLIVVGAGPGGYVSAIRAAQLGLKTAVVEKDKPGGVCGNWGCIPSKALINQAEGFERIKDLEAIGVNVDTSNFNYATVQKKSRDAADRSGKGVQFLLKKNKIEYIQGTAVLNGPQSLLVDGKEYKARFILLAAGSRPRQLPGFEFDENQVLSSTGILSLTQLPKSLIILGSGAIGMEFAYVMSVFGVKVTVVEMLPRILPLEDHETSAVVEKAFKARGVSFFTSAKATELKKNSQGVSLTLQLADNKTQILEAEKILVAVGRVPNTENLGLEKVGIKTDRGFVVVKDYYQTDVPSIYAIGDLIPSPLLAHVASKEGEIAVEHIAGKAHEKRVDPLSIPGATYCEPQIASFGYTEEKLKEKGLAYKAYTFPYTGNGKANAIEHQEGLVKVLMDAKTHEILGGHAAGAYATEIIHEILLARKAELLPEDIATMVHAHPTISESVMEAARGLEGWAIHI